MTLSKGAVGNLINRYRAVLRKCRMMNVFGSLAVAGMLVVGSAGIAGAEEEKEVELQGNKYEPLEVTSGVKSYCGVNDVTITPSASSRYAVAVSGGGTLAFRMKSGKLLVENTCSWNASGSQTQYDGVAAIRAAGAGSSGSFKGTGIFKATGGGKNVGVSAIVSSGKADLTLSGDITGEAIAQPNGDAGYEAYGAAAVEKGKLTFQGEKTTLKAQSQTGMNASGLYTQLGGMIYLES